MSLGTNNADQILVGNTGTLWKAPVGTTLPTSLAAPSAPFLSLGFISEDGPKFNFELTVKEIRAWQQRTAIDRRNDQENVSFEVALMEWDAKTLPAATGGTISSPSTGVYKLSPAAVGSVNYGAYILDVHDGTYEHRFVFPRASISGNVSSNFKRGDASLLPVKIDAVASSDSTDAWYFLTNSPAFDLGVAGS